MNDNTTIGAKGAEFGKELINSVRENPVSAALIGMGLLWLFTGGKSLNQIGAAGQTGLPQKAADAFTAGQTAVKSGMKAAIDSVSTLGSSAHENLKNVGHSIAETVSSAGVGIREGGKAAVQCAPEAASGIRSSAGSLVQSTPGTSENVLAAARSNLADLFQRQPLMLGAIGLAIGAGMAASFRLTEAEAHLLGETSDGLKRKAREVSMQQTRHAGEVAAGVAHAIAEEARLQGLTANELKTAVDDMGHKLKSVVGAATESVRGRSN